MKKNNSKHLAPIGNNAYRVQYFEGYELPTGASAKKLNTPKRDNSFLEPNRTYWYNDNYDRF